MSGNTTATGWTFAQVPIWLLANGKISDGAKVLFAYLKFRQGTDTACWPSKQTMASDLEVKPVTITRRLSELYDSGYVVKHCRPGHSNLYELMAAPDGEPERWQAKEDARKQAKKDALLSSIKNDTPVEYKNDTPVEYKNDTHDDSHERESKTTEDLGATAPIADATADEKEPVADSLTAGQDRQEKEPAQGEKVVVKEEPVEQVQLTGFPTLEPQSEAENILFAALGVEFAAKGRRRPTKFPTLAVKERYVKAAATLDGGLDGAIQQALAAGITAVPKVVGYVAAIAEGRERDAATQRGEVFVSGNGQKVIRLSEYG